MVVNAGRVNQFLAVFGTWSRAQKMFFKYRIFELNSTNG